MSFALLAIFGCLDPGEPGPRKPQDEYTAKKPGEWKNIAKDHLPVIKYHPMKTADNIEIFVPGNSFSESHYIEKIGIMDKEKRDVASKSFKRGERPGAFLTLDPIPEYSENYKIYVKCNLHDLWTVRLNKDAE